MGEQIMLKDHLKEHAVNAITYLSEVTTGVVGSQKTDVAAALGRGVQGMIKQRSLAQLAKELSDFQAKGKITDDFAESQQAWDCMNEAERAIHEEEFDSTKYEAIRRLFLNIAMQRFGDSKDILSIELMRLATTFSSLEIKLLNDVWSVFEAGGLQLVFGNHVPSRVHDWNTMIAQRGSLKHVELVEQAGRSLREKGILRAHPDGTTFIKGEVDGRDTALTTLGVAVCRLLCSDPDSKEEKDD